MSAMCRCARSSPCRLRTAQPRCWAQELLDKCHPLGMFDSIATLAVASNMRELYRLVLVDTPLAPYFSENLTHEDMDEMNIEIMRNTLYKAYLDDFAEFCKSLGGATAEVMGDLLAFEVRARRSPACKQGACSRPRPQVHVACGHVLCPGAKQGRGRRQLGLCFTQATYRQACIMQPGTCTMPDGSRVAFVAGPLPACMASSPNCCDPPLARTLMLADRQACPQHHAQQHRHRAHARRPEEALQQLRAAVPAWA